MANRKLGRYTKARVALLRNQVSELLWYGRIETTVEKAKEVAPLAEKIITLALNSANDIVKEKVKRTNLKGQEIEVEVVKDGPTKLAARRKMISYLRNIPELKGEEESKAEYKARTKDIKNPLIEKIFGEYVDKYSGRKDEGKAGGYTRIMRTGPRRGDGAELAIIEMI